MIKAFTILELLVVLIISAIVIDLGISVYQIAFKGFSSYRKINKKINEVSLLNSLLYSDVTKSIKIQKASNGVDLINSNDRIVSYLIEENWITRRQDSITDTFYLSIEKVELKFKDEEVNEIEKPIDEIYFETKILKKSELFHFKKEYDNYSLMVFEQLYK